MKPLKRSLTCVLVLLLCDKTTVWAQDFSNVSPSRAVDPVTNAVEETSKVTPDEAGFFKDMSTGIALIRPKRKTVHDAMVINGKVVVNSESRVENTLLIAKTFPINRPSHKRCQGATAWASCAAFMVGVGFNVGAQGSAGQTIDFLAVGLTVGSGHEAVGESAWYVGVGFGRRFNQKVLADGFFENQAIPAGETQVRYKYIDSTAPFAFITLRW